MSLSIMLLKRASAVEHGAEALTRGIRSAVSGSGRVGGALARGLGAQTGSVGETAGRVLGSAAPIAAAGYGVHKGKQRADQWRWQHGLMRAY